MQTAEPYVIVVDDDPMVPKLVKRHLNLGVTHFVTPQALLNGTRRYQPLAIFLDVHLVPHETSLGSIPKLKVRWPESPILVMTSDPDGTLLAEALTLGADDFVRKPLEAAELSARMHRRLTSLSKENESSTVEFEALKIQKDLLRISGEKGERELSPKLMSVLLCFVTAKGTVVDRSGLQAQVWGNTHVTTNAIDRTIYELRQAIAAVTDKVSIENTYRKGFRIIGTRSPKKKKAA